MLNLKFEATEWKMSPPAFGDSFTGTLERATREWSFGNEVIGTQTQVITDDDAWRFGMPRIGMVTASSDWGETASYHSALLSGTAQIRRA